MLPFVLAQESDYDAGGTFVDFARAFGDHKASAFLNYLLFRAGHGWGETKEKQCTWFETKPEIQAHTNLTPDEQDRVVQHLVKMKVLVIKKAAPPMLAQWQLQNVITGEKRKGYALFHYQMDWDHPIFSGFAYRITQEKGRGKNKVTETREMKLPEYVNYKCEAAKKSKAPVTAKNHQKERKKFKVEWRGLATQMVHRLIVHHRQIQKIKSGSKFDNKNFRGQISQKELGKVYRYLVRYARSESLASHIEEEFAYFCKIRDTFIPGNPDNYGAEGEHIPFGKTHLGSFFGKIFSKGPQPQKFFQNEWLNKHKKHQTSDWSEKAGRFEGATPKATDGLSTWEDNFLKKADKATRQKWANFAAFIKNQVRQKRHRQLSLLHAQQIYFGGLDQKSNILTFLVPSQYLYEQLEKDAWLRLIRQGIRLKIGEGIQLRYVVLSPQIE